MAGPTTRLGEFLRARREQLSPAERGMAVTGRRRTPGLRREEVAVLADLSSGYYTALEQGRGRRPSVEVVDSLARALALDPTERGHLHLLAGTSRPAVAPATVGPRSDLAGQIDLMVRQLDPYPTYVTDRRWNVTAANRGARALFCDWSRRPAGDRNLLLWMLTSSQARSVFVEWEQEAAAQLARYRAGAAQRPDDRQDQLFIELLHERSPQVRQWWPRHDVVPVASGSKLLHHPAVGRVRLAHLVLRLGDDPDLHVVTFSDPDGGTARLELIQAALG